MDWFAETLWIVAGFIFFFMTFYWVYQQYTTYLEGVAAGRLGNYEADRAKTGVLGVLVAIERRSPLYDMASKLKWFEKQKKKYAKEILAAGLNGKLDPNDIYAIRILLCIVAPVGLALFSLAQAEGIPPILLGFAVVSWFLPSALLSSIRKRRQKEILLHLPTILDLLTLSTEAGLDMMGALMRVTEKSRLSPLIEELTQVIKEVRLGVSRAEALRALAARVDMTEITSVVAVIVTADEMGASIGKVLRAQADAVRTTRFVRAEKAGAAAGQKMMFPLIFIILPAVFLMIFGPVIVSFFYTGSI